jgi:hypothetical protein
MRRGVAKWSTLAADNCRGRLTATLLLHAVLLHHLNAEWLSVNEGGDVDDDL